MKAKESNRLFDENKNVSKYLDISKAKKYGQEQKE